MTSNHFKGLWDAVDTMGADRVDHDPRVRGVSGFDIDTSLHEGLEIALDQLGVTGGLLSVEGRQVLLYIPDQGRQIEEVLLNPETGRKYHVADCSTLASMKEQGRFQRYTVTNNLTGVFQIAGIGPSGRLIEGDAKLNVCRNCLRYLNYRGYKAGGRRTQVFEEYSLEQFFESYSTLFRHMPREWVNRDPGYAANWPEISARVRAQANWTCKQCQVNLESDRRLLHVHHRDGNSQNNRDDNLVALCADCHRKQPFHERMFIRRDDMAKLQQLRRAQSVMPKAGAWAGAYELLDSAYEGVARLLEKKRESPPEIGLDICASDGAIVMTAELAWPSRRRAIVANDEELRKIQKLGWTGQTIAQVLGQYS